ncbi:MAG: DUF2666 family protein [Candidatus Micrarchaeota archaeon]
MDGRDEIIFTGEFKGFRLGVRYDLSGKNEGEVAAILSSLSESIEPYAFRFSGVDPGKIDAFLAVSGGGLGAVCSFLEGVPAKAVKEALGKSLPDPKLMPVAESYMLNRLLDKAGVPFKAKAGPVKGEDEKIGDFIGFIGKYQSWIAIKKLGMENVQDYEVSAILSGINHTIVNKSLDFAGLKRDDAAVQSAVAGKRRSLGNIAPALRAISPKLDGSADDAYIICKTLEALGYKPYASPEMLRDAHPDIKPPKVKGRKPKG